MTSAAPVTTRPVSQALLQQLLDADIVAERETVPSAGGWQGAPGASVFVPYCVLYAIPSMTDGSIANPDEDANHIYQVTAVGETADQAEALADLARRAMNATTSIDDDARQVVQSKCVLITGVVPDDTVQPRLWMSADRFGVTTTPKTEVAP